MSLTPSFDRPVISVLMANYNSEAYLKQAVESVLNQSFAALELILVDDGSKDSSVAIASAIAARDPRLKVFSGKRFGGPAPVRNFALDQARGEWVAVVDSDDLIHPDRFERMMTSISQTDADILIDDLLIFQNDGQGIETMFQGELARKPALISEEAYIRSNFLYRGGSALGYAKPLMRRSKLVEHGIRYNETMRIAEDYDLIVRLLAAGAVMRTMPDLLYFYRKHGASISHRLDERALMAIEGAAAAQLASGRPSAVTAAHRDRLANIRTAIGYDTLIKALKAKSPAGVLKVLTKTPAAFGLLRLPVMARLQTLQPKDKADKPDVAVMVRQRIVGATNGSSAYLLAILNYLKSQGRKVTILWPTPYTFGRWPVLSLKPELAALDGLHWRGGLRIGSRVVSIRPKVWWDFVLTALEAVLMKLKVVKARFVPPALSALMAAYDREDLLFVARNAKGANALIADYAFDTPYLPYALSPDAPSVVIMHDLFSSRTDQFKGQAVKDLYGHLEFDQEMRMLGVADAVVAIQKHEAGIVARALPGQAVIVAPMANDPVTDYDAGNSDTVLFVGSNAAPNVLGMQWFFAEVWPLVLARRPQTRLKVAGSVGRDLTNVPANVQILGMVDDLAPLYREAGVMISPLTTGSGLKIKMIEALSKAKASVVTSVTLQGIEDVVGEAVVLSDDPLAFADGIVDLLDHPEKRLMLAGRAIEVVRGHFSSEACFGEIRDFLGGKDQEKDLWLSAGGQSAFRKV